MSIPHATVSPCDSRLWVSIICRGGPSDGSVSPSFPSQGTSDIMGIPVMPGQDDPKADIRQQGREQRMSKIPSVVVMVLAKWVTSMLRH